MARRRRRPRRKRERPGDKYFREYKKGLRSKQQVVPGPPAPRYIPASLPVRPLVEKPLVKMPPRVVASPLESDAGLPRLPRGCRVISGVVNGAMMPNPDQYPGPASCPTPISHVVPPQGKTPPAQAERGLPVVETDTQKEAVPARVGPLCPLLGETCLGPNCQWFDGISKCSMLSVNESLSHLISLMNSLHAFLEYWKKDQ